MAAQSDTDDTPYESIVQDMAAIAGEREAAAANRNADIE